MFMVLLDMLRPGLRVRELQARVVALEVERDRLLADLAARDTAVLPGKNVRPAHTIRTPMSQFYVDVRPDHGPIDFGLHLDRRGW